VLGRRVCSNPTTTVTLQGNAKGTPELVKEKGKKAKRRKKRRASSNPFIQAAIQCDEEGGLSGGDSGYDSLEDFIVCKPGRNYAELLKRKYAAGEGHEGERGGERGEQGDDAAVPPCPTRDDELRAIEALRAARRAPLQGNTQAVSRSSPALMLARRQHKDA
jgi:hypothetical protein